MRTGRLPPIERGSGRYSRSRTASRNPPVRGANRHAAKIFAGGIPMAVRDLTDIAAIEAVPLSERALPESTYAALVASAKRTPDARALSFFLSADRLDETHRWTYAELVADVTRAANAFAAFGVASDRPVAFVLPNLPETHFAIWGGEAAGAALAINPMLEPKQIADLMRAARASILVTLAPALNPKAWS